MSRITRRRFLQTGAAGIAAVGIAKSAAAAPGPPKPPPPPKKKKFSEALVIGSGFGGAVAALRLAQVGVETTVLERGRRWDIVDAHTFSTFNGPDGRSSWFSTTANALIPSAIDSYPGVLELLDPTTPGGFLRNNLHATGVAVRTGAGVGGGSLVFNAAMLQPRQALFERVFPKDIKYGEMATVYYPRVADELALSTIPNDVLNAAPFASTRANLVQAQNAGMDLGTQVMFAIDWDVVREEIATTKVASAIDGQSWYGLNSGAKNSVDKNYLKAAEGLGAEILPLHVVTDIAETTGPDRKNGRYAVSVNHIDTGGNVLETLEFTCNQVFLAAGAMGTSSLLTKARAKGTLPKLNAFVGTEWGTNGNWIAIRGGLGTFAPAQGGPCGHFLFEDAANPVSASNMVELVTPKDFEQLALGNAPGFSFYLGEGLAPGLGTFSYNAGTDTVTLNWPNIDAQLAPFSGGANSLLSRLNAANPGSFTAFNSEDPTYKASGAPALTLEPVGGVVIGKATDKSGQLHGYPGLYVVDGSLIPGGAVGVNPAWTIAALAERTMDKVLKGF